MMKHFPFSAHSSIRIRVGMDDEVRLIETLLEQGLGGKLSCRLFMQGEQVLVMNGAFYHCVGRVQRQRLGQVSVELDPLYRGHPPVIAEEWLHAI